MSFTKSVVAGLALALVGSAAIAGEMKVFPYNASANYCPSGLQPVTVGGVICCGAPNMHQTYQSYMAHPTPKKVRHVAKARDFCPEGTKGCY